MNTLPPIEAAAAEPAPARRTRIYRGWWLVGAAMLAQFVTVGIQAFTPGIFLKPMTEDLGWTRTQFTLALTVGQFIMGITGFFIGAHIDRHGARPLMMIGVTVLGTATLLTAFVTELWQWMLLRGVVFTIGGGHAGATSW